MNLTLVNLETGDTITADPYRLRELGIPDGYVVADRLTTEEWIQALQKAIESRR